MSVRPAIPEKIKRAVRQRCGFGCVICGMPIYHYDHMLGYAAVPRHVAEEITLLCPNHHQEKTNGLMPDIALQRANAHPHNLSTGRSGPYILQYQGNAPEVIMGGQRFLCMDARRPTVMIPIMVHGTPLLGFHITTKSLGLNLQAFNSRNERILEIRENEVVYSASVWDVTLIGNRLAIREAAREFIVDLEFEVPNRVIVHAYRLQRDGFIVELNQQEIQYRNPTGVSLTVTGDGFISGNIGILIGGHAPNGMGVGIYHPDEHFRKPPTP